MEFSTANFYAIHTEGEITYFLNSLEGARIIRNNTRHWLSRREFAVDNLSNTAAEVVPNELAFVVTGAVRKLITLKLLS